MPGWKREWFQDCVSSQNHSPFIILLVSSLKSHWVLGSRRGGYIPADVCPVGTTQPYLLSGLCPPKNKASYYSLTGARGLRGWDLNDSVTNVSRQQVKYPSPLLPLTTAASPACSPHLHSHPMLLAPCFWPHQWGCGSCSRERPWSASSPTPCRKETPRDLARVW